MDVTKEPKFLSFYLNGDLYLLAYLLNHASL